MKRFLKYSLSLRYNIYVNIYSFINEIIIKLLNNAYEGL